MIASILASGGATVPTIDWSTLITSDALAPLTSAITSVLPIVLPVSIGVVAIRKGVSFVLGMIRSA